ncbi:unnamed protein product [Mytilus coruscus]|uniref:Mab-21-like HhH/H2TH-like domain-containing protein n=1 Tax=Mytilus coruscus TaxID=42192 RepID=A0A6J8BXW6_MYTCO|nr:unnamed protein product [Mytilus coruscus]
MMNNVRDNLTIINNKTVITSGSFGEGLEMQGSDIDTMNILKYFEICEDTDIPFNPDKPYFAMETYDTPPGYTQLRLLHSNLWQTFQFCEKRGHAMYFSNALLKQYFAFTYLSIVHGPCLSDKHGFFYFAVCLKSESWITAAKPWIARSNNGWPGTDVEQFIKFSTFHELVFHQLKEPNYLLVDGIEKLLRSIMNVLDCTTGDFTLEKRNRIAHVASTFESSKIQYLYWYYMSKSCRQSVQFLPFKDTCTPDNKSDYRQYKILISTILRNLHHDAVSGWLLFASFLFYTKQYSSAIYILQYSLSKCSEEKIQPLIKLSHIHQELFSLSVFRKMNIVQLWKFMLLDSVYFWPSSTLIPNELQIMVKTQECVIPPVVYAHFLSFLCHYHLNNTSQCRDSIQDLQLTIEEKYFIADKIDEAVCYNILGIAFKLLRDEASANKAFMHSVRLNPNPDLRRLF